MNQTAIIGGVERHMGAWKPSRFKLTAPKPDIDVTKLRMRHTIEKVPKDYDQGQLGSCGPNALAELYEFLTGQKFSRLFAYYFTRATEGDVGEDGGVTIPDLLDVAHTMGMPLESLWPYDIAKYRDVPSLQAFAEAFKHRVIRNDIVVDLEHLLYELDNEQPVLFGFQVPSSMQTAECARTGLVNVPSATDPSIGGHAVLACGFDRELERVQTTSHYGEEYGDHGTLWLPFAHFKSGNACDLRAARSVS